MAQMMSPRSVQLMKYFDDQGASNPSFRPDSEFTYDDLPDEYKMTDEEELFQGFSGVFGMEGSAGNAGRNLNNEQKFAYLQDNFGDRPGFQGAIDRYKRNAADQAEQFKDNYAGTGGPMVPMDPTSKKLYDDMMGTGGFLPGNPKPSDYDRDFGFLGDMEKPQGPMIPPEDLDRPPQIYRPPADDPRDPRTKGMYPTGGFDYPPIAPTPTDPIVPQMPSPLDPGPIAPSGPMVPFISQPQERTATGITSLAPEGSFQAQFLKLQAENPNDPRYAGEVPDYVSPENLQLAADNPNDPRYNQGIMGQAPAGMSDPNMMDMMRSPMDRSANYQSPSQRAGSPFGGNFSSYLTGGNSYGPVGGFGGGTSGYGAMGTGMSAGGGIMSMANPMQAQMAMMPQQMMQQGGYAPQPQQQQSLYGTQTGSQNNPQSLYGPQFNSPFAGASRGYYA